MTTYSGNNTVDLHIPEMWVSGSICRQRIEGNGGSVIPPGTGHLMTVVNRYSQHFITITINYTVTIDYGNSVFRYNRYLHQHHTVYTVRDDCYEHTEQ